MKEQFKNFTTLLLICVVILLLIQRGCNPKPPQGVITEIETRYDTINTITEVYVPQYKYKTIINTDTIKEIDTVEVIKDYYTQYFYSDTLDLDTSGFLVINDTIFNNKIYSRQLESHIIIPTTTITNTIYENKRELYVGIESGINNKAEINYIGADVLFKTKRKQIYGIGLGVDNNFNPTIMASMYWKLGKK